MKRKTRGGVSSKVGSSTLAYPGNSFKYSPLLPNDTSLQKTDTNGTTSAPVDTNLTTSVLTNTTETTPVPADTNETTFPPAESTAAKTTSTAFSDKKASGSGPTSRKKAQTRWKLPKVVTDFDQLSRQSKIFSQECEELNSPPVLKTSGSSKEDQEQLQPEKEIVDILQKVEKDIREIELFSKQLSQKVKNGPQKI